MGAAIPALPPFQPPQAPQRPLCLRSDTFGRSKKLPSHWVSVVDEPAKDHPGCRSVRVLLNEGLSLPSPAFLKGRQSYSPSRQRVVVKGRVLVHGLWAPEHLDSDAKDAVVWFCSTRALGYGNGILCSLVVRHYFRDFQYSRYEMHIAASAAPYRPPPPPNTPILDPVYADRAPAAVIFPFATVHEMHAEPTTIDAFDFLVMDDGRKVEFTLNRHTDRGNSEHSLSLLTSFQASPGLAGCHVGVGTGDALYDRVLLTDVYYAGYPLRRRFRRTDILRGCCSEVKTALLMATHNRLGARSKLHALPTSVLFRILHFLKWSDPVFYHDQSSGLLGEAPRAAGRERLATDEELRRERGRGDGSGAEGGCSDSTIPSVSSDPTFEPDTPPSGDRALIAGPAHKWSELWWQPRQNQTLLMTRRDFSYDGGALLYILRFIYGRVSKRLAVVSRVTWTAGNRAPADFTSLGMVFTIAGGAQQADAQRQHDPREVFEMVISVGGRVLTSMMFGAIELGDILEYHIYDDGHEYAFKLLHSPRSALEDAVPPVMLEDFDEEEATPAPNLHASSSDVLDSSSTPATPFHAGVASPLESNVGTMGWPDSETGSELSVQSLVPSLTCNAHTLRGCFRWAPERFPVLLTVAEDDPAACTVEDLEYEHFAVHHLLHKGCPF